MSTPAVPPVQRIFDGARRLDQRSASWPGLRAEMNAMSSQGPARSELCVTQDALLATVSGGAQSVSVVAEGAPAWTGPKLKGAAGFFPAGRHLVSYWPQADVTYFVLLVEPNATDELIGQNTGGATWRTRPHVEDAFLSTTIERLAEALKRTDTDPLAPLLAETLATSLHLHVVDRFSNLGGPAGSRDNGVERVLELIHDELPRSVTLARMVELSGLPRGRFLAAFRQRTGVSPHQFILHERLQRARRLLESTQRSVAEIAQDVGCANSGHLTQLFRRHLNTTPRVWRHQRGRF